MQEALWGHQTLGLGGKQSDSWGFSPVVTTVSPAGVDGCCCTEPRNVTQVNGVVTMTWMLIQLPVSYNLRCISLLNSSLWELLAYPIFIFFSVWGNRVTELGLPAPGLVWG